MNRPTGGDPAIPRALDELAKIHRAYITGERGEPEEFLARYNSVPVLGHWLEHWGPDAPYGGHLILRTAVDGYLEPARPLPPWATPTLDAAEAAERARNARFTRWRWGIGCPPVEEGRARALTGVVPKTLGNRAKVVLRDPNSVARVAWLIAGPPRVTIPLLADEEPGRWVTPDPASHWREQVRRTIGVWRAHQAEASPGARDLRVDAGQALALTQLALARAWFAGSAEPDGTEDPGYRILVALVLEDSPSLWREIPLSGGRGAPSLAGSSGPTGTAASVDHGRGQAGEPQARRRAERLVALLRAESGRQAVMLPRALRARSHLEDRGAGRLDPAEEARLERDAAPCELEAQLAVAAYRPSPVALAGDAPPVTVRDAGVLVASSYWPRPTQVAPADMRTRQRYIRESIGPTCDREQVTRLFLEYLEVRRTAIERTGHLDSVGLAEIALADHGVAYDAVVFEDDLVLARVAEHLRAPLSGRPDLYAYAGRNDALTLSKSGRFGDALRALGGAVRQITQLGTGHHPVVMGELREQLRLAHAGLFVRVTEQLLLRADAYPPSRAGSYGSRWEDLADTIAWTGTQALLHAHSALDDVAELAGMLGGLPAVRHARFDDDNALVITNVTTAWQVMPTIQALRAALAVRVAIAAGVVTEARLFESATVGPAGGASTTDADPWWEHHRDRVREASRLETIEARLVELMVEQPVTTAHAPLVVPLVLQHAFLTGGRVLPPAAAASPIAAIAPFLTAPPDAAGRPVMDWDAATHWLSEGRLDGDWPPETSEDDEIPGRPGRRHDAQYLSWLAPALGRRRGLVFQALTDASGGEYARFRELHDPYRPDRPSHD